MTKELEPKVIVGLEVGTSKVVAVVGEVLPDGVVNVLGVGSCPSKGIDRGSITDLDAVVNSIQRAIEAAESMADCQIMSVTLAITGEHIQSLMKVVLLLFLKMKSPRMRLMMLYILQVR